MDQDDPFVHTPGAKDRAPLSFLEREHFPRRMFLSSIGFGLFAAARWAYQSIDGIGPLVSFGPARNLDSYAEFDFQNTNDLPGWTGAKGTDPDWKREEGAVRPTGPLLYHPSMNAIAGEASYIIHVAKGAASFVLHSDPELKSFYAIRVARVKNDLEVRGFLIENRKERPLATPPITVPNAATRGAHLCTVSFEDEVMSLKINGTTVFSAQDATLQGGVIGLLARKQDSFYVFSSRIKLA
jgi:hypothetical protein